jgi:DNA-binding transcriptional ArsR family regulator
MSAAVALEALAEPNRRRIVELLCDGERSVGELAAGAGLAQPAVSKHLRVLKQAGLVEVRREAQRRLYRIRPEPLAELDAWLEPYRRLWDERLDLLEHHLKERPQ